MLVIAVYMETGVNVNSSVHASPYSANIESTDRFAKDTFV